MLRRYSPSATDPAPSVPSAIARARGSRRCSFMRAVTRYRIKNILLVPGLREASAGGHRCDPFMVFIARLYRGDCTSADHHATASVTESANAADVTNATGPDADDRRADHG